MEIWSLDPTGQIKNGMNKSSLLHIIPYKFTAAESAPEMLFVAFSLLVEVWKQGETVQNIKGHGSCLHRIMWLISEYVL